MIIRLCIENYLLQSKENLDFIKENFCMLFIALNASIPVKFINESDAPNTLAHQPSNCHQN